MAYAGGVLENIRVNVKPEIMKWVVTSMIYVLNIGTLNNLKNMRETFILNSSFT